MKLYRFRYSPYARLHLRAGSGHGSGPSHRRIACDLSALAAGQSRSALDASVALALSLLAPTVSTLAQRPFLFGEEPTLADAALYGNCIMLEEPQLLPLLSPALAPYLRRVEAAALKTA